MGARVNRRLGALLPLPHGAPEDPEESRDLLGPKAVPILVVPARLDAPCGRLKQWRRDGVERFEPRVLARSTLRLGARLYRLEPPWSDTTLQHGDKVLGRGQICASVGSPLEAAARAEAPARKAPAAPMLSRYLSPSDGSPGTTGPSARGRPATTSAAASPAICRPCGCPPRLPRRPIDEPVRTPRRPCAPSALRATGSHPSTPSGCRSRG